MPPTVPSALPPLLDAHAHLQSPRLRSVLPDVLRRAADAINSRMDAYTLSHPGNTALELMSLVALNETLFRMNVQKEMEQFKESEKQLDEDLERYLKDIK